MTSGLVPRTRVFSRTYWVHSNSPSRPRCELTNTVPTPCWTTILFVDAPGCDAIRKILFGNISSMQGDKLTTVDQCVLIFLSELSLGTPKNQNVLRLRKPLGFRNGYATTVLRKFSHRDSLPRLVSQVNKNYFAPLVTPPDVVLMDIRDEHACAVLDGPRTEHPERHEGVPVVGKLRMPA